VEKNGFQAVKIYLGRAFYFVALRIVYILPHHLVKGVWHIICGLNRRKEALDKPSNLSYHHNKFRCIQKRILADFGGDAFFDPYADHYDEIILWEQWRKQGQTATTTRPNSAQKAPKAGVEGSETTLGAGCRVFESPHSDH